jgi:hypothetical protein
VSCSPAGALPNSSITTSINNDSKNDNKIDTETTTHQTCTSETSDVNTSEPLNNTNEAQHINTSQEERDAGLKASMQAIHHPVLTSGSVLTRSPLVCLPDKPTPFQHPSQLPYPCASTMGPTTTPSDLAAAAKSFKRVAQHQVPSSLLQRTPQLCLRRLGNTQSDDDKYFMSTVKYQQESRAYGRSSWQAVEFSHRFDLQEASCVVKAHKLTKPTLQKQHSDDLATDKTDTQVGMGRTVCPYVTYVLHKRKTYVYIRMCVKIGRKTYALAHIRIRVAYVGHTTMTTATRWCPLVVVGSR